jgi:micrococcal nuclease
VATEAASPLKSLSLLTLYAGPQARVSVFLFRKGVILQTHGPDKYGRTLADVFLLDGTNVNHMLVKEGRCWWYRKYAPLDMELEKLEREARDAKKGLWIDPRPVPPWEWRKRSR